MKQIIAFILMPITIICWLFQIVADSYIGEIAISLANGIKNLFKSNYDFWAKIFKWN